MSGQQHASAALYPRKDPVPTVQEAGWASGPVWTRGKSRPHRNSIPDRPASSSVAIPTELPGPHIRKIKIQNICECAHNETIFFFSFTFTAKFMNTYRHTPYKTLNNMCRPVQLSTSFARFSAEVQSVHGQKHRKDNSSLFCTLNSILQTGLT